MTTDNNCIHQMHLFMSTSVFYVMKRRLSRLKNCFYGGQLEINLRQISYNFGVTLIIKIDWHNCLTFKGYLNDLLQIIGTS